jgi:hypothetical protein
VNDSRVIAAAKNAVRVIVRRPHAHRFCEQYEDAPLTGFVVLDADGQFVGAVKLPSKTAVDTIVDMLGR